VSLRDVSVIYISGTMTLPIKSPLFTNRIMFRSQTGQIESIFCSNKKIIEEILKMANAGRFRKAMTLHQFRYD